MKLRYLFSIILSSVLVFASCEEKITDSWENIKLDQTYLSIAENGGSATLTIDATEDWAFVTDDVWPEVIKRDKEGNITSSTPSWLKADKMSGAAGQTKVTFTAEGTASGRELELKIKAGDNVQFVRVRQGSMTVTKATVAEIIAGIVKNNESMVKERQMGAMGPLMGMSMKKLKGKADGSLVNKIVREEIQNLL